MPTTVTARDWSVLLDSLERRTCAVLVGPGLPVRGPAGAARNLSIALSQKLAAELKTDHDLVVEDPDNLPLVAEFFLDRSSRADLEFEVRNFYTEALHERPDPTFDDLASLPFTLFVSSRHDLVLEHYLRPRRTPDSFCYSLRGDAQPTLGVVGTVERPLVYHLLGSISDPASLVLTESELLDLLRSIASDAPPLPKDLVNAFASKSFLFIGCELHAYYTRALLHMLELSRSGQRAFALESTPVNKDRHTFHLEYRLGVWFYEVGYKTLKLIDWDEQKFIKELRRRWEAQASDGEAQASDGEAQASDGEAQASDGEAQASDGEAQASDGEAQASDGEAQASDGEAQASDGEAPATTTTAADSPLVFLSYFRKDADDAQQLINALAGHGIAIWRDTDRLKSGDRWLDRIADVIQKEVDFFIVLHSAHLKEGVETYVHQEIEIALKRRSRRGRRMKFIYPVSLTANAHRLYSLDDLHVQHLVDLDAAVGHLASDIRKQFAQLQRD